jgi:hypothetical protein
MEISVACNKHSIVYLPGFHDLSPDGLIFLLSKKALEQVL